MRYSLAFALAAFALACAPAAQAAVQITIDKSAQLMTVERDGRALYQWPVSTGKAGFDTPSGKFKAFRMERDHYSREWDDAPMPFSIFFTQKGHAIHGSLDTKNIGRPASHGCVRLTPANAEKLFALVQEDGVLNTTVILTGTAPAARRRWRSSARRMRVMCSAATAHIRPALRLEPAGLWQSVICAAAIRAAAICPAAIRSALRAAAIRAAAVWPAHLRPAAIRAAATPGLCRSIRPTVPAPGHAVSLLAPAAENLWTRRLR